MPLYSLPLTGKECSGLPYLNRPCFRVTLGMVRAGWYFPWLTSLGLILHGASLSGTPRNAGCASSCQHARELSPMDSEIPPYPWPRKYGCIISSQSGPKFDRENRQADPVSECPPTPTSPYPCFQTQWSVMFGKQKST